MAINFKFKVAKVVKPRNTSRTVLGGITKGIVTLVDGEYKCEVDYNGDTKMNLPFTDESYDLKGKLYIFSRTKGKYGYICVIRDTDKSIFQNVNTDKYIPFAPNWIIKGYIVRIDKKLYFEFKGLVTINGYERRVHEE